jgi:hypothetical protein
VLSQAFSTAEFNIFRLLLRLFQLFFTIPHQISLNCILATGKKILSVIQVFEEMPKTVAPGASVNKEKIIRLQKYIKLKFNFGVECQYKLNLVFLNDSPFP